MKILHCSDIGERTCNYQVQGETVEEVERKLLDHEYERHPLFMQGLSTEAYDHLIKQMDAMVENR